MMSADGLREVEVVRREVEGRAAEELLGYVVTRWGEKVALASSLGAEDQVITDMLARIGGGRIFTLDTGRLPEETYKTIEAVWRKYSIRINLAFPEREHVEAMVGEHGPNLFNQSVELRKKCCGVRKVVPLKRELAGLAAWITGLRREQGVTRTAVERVEWDEANGLIKINPLADWTADDVWTYIRENGVPYNKLHDLGYPSIGCAPCTRAVAAGEDLRAGRWWWERPEQKECGLHRR